ncbi:MAG: CAP domain-containing protein [Myxococcota bacterium]|nr:CAP domain-containing protein [Myxococcota bacterium]
MLKLILASWLMLNASPNLDLESSLLNHGWGRITYDLRLENAAQELGQLIANSKSGLEPDALGQRLAFTLARHKIVDAQVIPFTIGPSSTPNLSPHIPSLISRLNRRERPTHYGHYVHFDGHHYVMTVLLLHRGAELTVELPRKARLNETIEFTGRLERGYYQPRLIVHSPLDGFVEQPDDRHGRNFGFAFGFGHGPGAYRLELVAGSQYGPVVLVQHTIHVEEPVPPLPVIKLHPKPILDTDEDYADRLFFLINKHRTKNGFKPLKHNIELTQIALSHARELAKSKSLSHASPDTGTLTTRVRRRGLNPLFVAENLADASTAETALQAFLDSPGHARNLVIESLTDVGVAYVGRYFVVTLASLLPKN